MSLYDILKRAIGWPPDQIEARPPMAQLTIISTEPISSPSESRSARARD